MLGGRKFLRFGLLLAALLISMGSGYRGSVVLMCLTLTTLFFLEKIWRTKYVGLFVLGVILVCALIVPFATSLPLPIQRSLSVLPIEVSPQARDSADASSQWRIDMWKSVLPEIPKYFWFGRGLTLGAQQLFLEDDLTRTGRVADYSSFEVVSDFHNGPLSVIIPFGIWGVIGWLWFLAASIRALWLNRKYGEGHLQTANNFILAMFLAKTVFFLFVFGNFYTDVYQFCSLVGLSLCLNYGIRKPVVVKPVYRPIVLRRRRPSQLTLAPAAPRLGTAER
jgi:O-antigen ligase